MGYNDDIIEKTKLLREKLEIELTRETKKLFSNQSNVIWIGDVAEMAHKMAILDLILSRADKIDDMVDALISILTPPPSKQAVSGPYSHTHMISMMVASEWALSEIFGITYDSIRRQLKESAKRVLAEVNYKRAMAALRFMDAHNPIRNDWDAYLGAVAQWGMGIEAQPPDPLDYGVVTLIGNALEVD